MTTLTQLISAGIPHPITSRIPLPIARYRVSQLLKCHPGRHTLFLDLSGFLCFLVPFSMLTLFLIYHTVPRFHVVAYLA